MRRTAAAIALLLAATCAGCGTQQAVQTTPSRDVRPAARPPHKRLAQPSPHAHPQVIEPTAGEVGAGTAVTTTTPSAVSVGPSSSGTLAQPTSDATIRQELARSGLSGSLRRATLTPGGLAIPPVQAPPAVQQVIEAGNEIAHLPYRFGGGHGTFEDSAYDCSGSLSFVFAAAGLLNTTYDSTEFMRWGARGPGRWITVFATHGHTFMYVAGLRFDTVALAETGSRWSDRSADEPNLRSFAIRHPPRL